VRRFGLLVFGIGFVVLFAIAAIAEGIGHPSVPAGDVALVEDVPGDDGNITKAKFSHAMELAAAEAKLPKVPQPGDDQYEEMRDGAMEKLLQTAWVRGQAAEMGISVSDEEVAEKVKELREQQFKSEAEYQKTIKELHLTQADVNEVMELQALTPQIEEKVHDSAPEPSDSEVEDYYEEVKETQFKQPATRDVRLILNKDKKKAERAMALLEKDNSPENWDKVAKEFSTESLSKKEGGLRRGLEESALKAPVGTLIFETPEDELEGVVKNSEGFYVFEVEDSTPESVQSLDDVRNQIVPLLEQQAGEAVFHEFVFDFEETWRSRTFCASGFEFKLCANFKENADPAVGDPTLEKCRQSVPSKEFPESCPSPIRQLAPALPGTVSLLAPGGTGSSLGVLSAQPQPPLPQRPRPAGLPEEEEVPVSEAPPVAP
jgi:parvulin-like peptidyl-prolyl isomerase